MVLREWEQWERHWRKQQIMKVFTYSVDLQFYFVSMEYYWSLCNLFRFVFLKQQSSKWQEGKLGGRWGWRLGAQLGSYFNYNIKRKREPEWGVMEIMKIGLKIQEIFKSKQEQHTVTSWIWKILKWKVPSKTSRETDTCTNFQNLTT